MPVLVVQVEDYRTLLRLPFDFWFRFDLLHRRKCTFTHVCASKHRVHF